MSRSHLDEVLVVVESPRMGRGQAIEDLLVGKALPARSSRIGWLEAQMRPPVLLRARRSGGGVHT